MDADIHLPDDWAQALERLGDRRRIAVIGATDVGKSSFVRSLLARRPGLALIDLDPGQKMVGPPGTLSVGVPEGQALRLQRFHFLGSTSSADIFHLSRGAAALAAEAEPFVANTSGFVKGPGARLQSATIAALGADAILAIGAPEPLEPILSRHPHTAAVVVQPSPLATRKRPAACASARQASFVAALEGAAEIELSGVSFTPGPPAVAELGSRHPVCALADEEDMTLGVLLGLAEDRVRLLAPLPPRAPRQIRLGRMWAAPADGGWKLLETLSPAWLHHEPEG